MLLVDTIAGLADTVIKRIWPDATEEEKTRLEAFKIAIAAEAAVHETNRAEAQHPSIFVAGWRPFTGWVCGAGLAYQFLLQPLFAWGSLAIGIPIPPPLELASLITVLTGMLGLGAARTFEGIRGAKRSIWPTGSSK